MDDGEGVWGVDAETWEHVFTGARSLGSGFFFFFFSFFLPLLLFFFPFSFVLWKFPATDLQCFCIKYSNLDSIFKSRDITLPTKVHLVQAMVFPVVMYGCESWTVKKAER